MQHAPTLTFHSEVTIHYEKSLKCHLSFTGMLMQEHRHMQVQSLLYVKLAKDKFLFFNLSL